MMQRCDRSRQKCSNSGDTCATAVSGDDAMSLVRAHREPVHLLLTDVVLSDGMNGGEVAKALLQQSPALKLLYMSGYTADVTLSHGLTEQDGALLQKPFTADALSARVRHSMRRD